MNRQNGRLLSMLTGALVIACLTRVQIAAACSSFGQANGCFNSDPCDNLGALTCIDPPPCDSIQIYCGDQLEATDATGARVPISCPTTCPMGATCGGEFKNHLSGVETFEPWACLQSCQQLGVQCGVVEATAPGGGDWGAYLVCPSCPSGQVCAGTQCCTPATCASLVASCGSYSDGCGGTISCGGCASGLECNSSTKQCCTPTTCNVQGAQCGTLPDECGGTLNCGTCPFSGESCSLALQCRCTNPATCQSGQCGARPDDCGGTLQCGSCASGQVCTLGGTCCRPKTACTDGQTCGQQSDGCGGTLNCGTCTANQVCTVSNECCTPQPASTVCSGRVCGTWANGCGGGVHCGDCANGLFCAPDGMSCASTPPATPILPGGPSGTVAFGAVMAMVGVSLVRRRRAA
jgi:hypothetical protein